MAWKFGIKMWIVLNYDAPNNTRC